MPGDSWARGVPHTRGGSGHAAAGPPPQHGRRAAPQCATGLPLIPCRAARAFGAAPQRRASPEFSVAAVKEAFDRTAPDGLLDVGLVGALLRHFRLNPTVQELEDGVNAVVGNGHLLVFQEFLWLMTWMMKGTDTDEMMVDAFNDAEEPDSCSASSWVPMSFGGR